MTRAVSFQVEMVLLPVILSLLLFCHANNSFASNDKNDYHDKEKKIERFRSLSPEKQEAMKREMKRHREAMRKISG